MRTCVASLLTCGIIAENRRINGCRDLKVVVRTTGFATVIGVPILTLWVGVSSCRVRYTQGGELATRIHFDSKHDAQHGFFSRFQLGSCRTTAALPTGKLDVEAGSQTGRGRNRHDGAADRHHHDGRPRTSLHRDPLWPRNSGHRVRLGQTVTRLCETASPRSDSALFILRPTVCKVRKIEADITASAST